MSINILIPAHNEANVIAHTLMPLAGWAAAGHANIIVIANACIDNTAEIARAACPAATVLETPVGGKTNALNLGAHHVVGGAVVCLDADLVTTPEALEALAAPLLDGTAAGTCGRMEVSLDGAPFWVRQFYSGWLLNPYQDAGKFGGLFGISERSLGTLFPLPSLTADDEFIARSLEAGGIAFVPECSFTVRAPRLFRDLVAIRRRSHRGTRALSRQSLTTDRPTGLRAITVVLQRAALKPGRWLGVLTYVALILWVRARVAFEHDEGPDAMRWERDESSRNLKEV
jgi:glycosyltransferase involved in cell wall biosynthesis